jgi:hypothetical protein
MRTKTVKRHYCDHCGKGGFFANRMTKHEQGCTKNVNRVCGFCAIAGLKQTPLEDLFACLNEITADNRVKVLEQLRNAAQGCPACMLTALRHHHKTTFDVRPEDQDGQVGVEFNFKDECKGWWQTYNDDKNLYLHQNQ